MVETVRIVMGETCVDVTADARFLRLAEPAAAEARRAVESRIAEDPFFGTTYSPYPASPGDHPVVRSMCEASVAASVGPMAAVAGAIASHVVEAMREAGCAYAIADNGGDVTVLSDREISVGIGTGDPGMPAFAISVGPTDGIVGVCSSSARVGHSVSLGGSDVCTVVAEDVALADACATALGNMAGSGADLGESAERIRSIPGVVGCLAVAGGKVSVCGDIRIRPLRALSALSAF